MTISDIKKLIKNRRLELHLTLKDVATAVGVSEGTVSRWEAGNISNMKRNRISALAKILEISPALIMGWSEEESKSYYNNPETAKLAQELYDNPDRRVLLDATRDLRPEDVKALTLIIKQMKKKDGSN